MVWWVACPAALAAAAFLTCGWRGLAFAVGQAVVRCGAASCSGRLPLRRAVLP